MNTKTVLTKREVSFPDDKLLISKTNANGIITYFNTIFLQVSGFSEAELIGQPHSIVRHPDMPRVIFKMLWDTLKQHREFNGYFKDMTKTGETFWVFVTITPSYNLDHQLNGYYMVCRKPEDEKLEYIKGFYQELKEIEEQSNSEEGLNQSLFKLNTVLNARECGYDEFILSI